MKIKILKPTLGKRVGDIVNVSFPGGDSQEYVDNGYIEILEKEKVKKKPKKEIEQQPIEQVIVKLKEIMELPPLELEDELQKLAKESGRKLTRLKEQLKYFKNKKRVVEEQETKNYPIENLNKKIGNMFDKKELAEHIIEVQPCLYDTSRSWWLWNWPETKWERVDETDILNAIDKQATVNTINSKEKGEMLEALKQVSRLNTPAPIGKYTIQFKNTLVNIKTGENQRATPLLFVTNPIPWDLDEDGFSETPVMDRIFEEWVGKDNIQTLYEILAYCLIPDYPIHRIFCFIGAGMNGKSCFLNLLRKFVGSSNCCSTELDTLLQSRFEVTRLHKKLVCQMGETNFSEMNKTSVLKKLSGGDLIGFEYKNKDPFEEINYAKILIATNNLPTTTDKTIGFYRRWMIIDFPNQFSEKKDILADIPDEEYRALAVKCSFILKDILDSRTFTNEGSIEERMKKYEDHSDPLEKFMKEYTIEKYDGYIWKGEFEKKLNEWCKSNRFREMTSVAIGKKMAEKGIEQKQKYEDWMNDYGKKGGRAWVGLAWNNEPQTA